MTKHTKRPTKKTQKSKKNVKNRVIWIVVACMVLICSNISTFFIGKNIGFNAGQDDGRNITNAERDITEKELTEKYYTEKKEAYKNGHANGYHHGYNAGYSDGLARKPSREKCDEPFTENDNVKITTGCHIEGYVFNGSI